MDRTEIKPGMTVTYKEKHKDSEIWADGMEQYIGKPIYVLNIDDTDNTALCEVGDLMLWVDINWLELWRENNMKIGEAWAIFNNIDSDRYTVEEKGPAIKIILEMEMHNSVTKAMFMKALKWLWNKHFEWKGE